MEIAAGGTVGWWADPALRFFIRAWWAEIPGQGDVAALEWAAFNLRTLLP